MINCEWIGWLQVIPAREVHELESGEAEAVVEGRGATQGGDKIVSP